MIKKIIDTEIFGGFIKTLWTEGYLNTDRLETLEKAVSEIGCLFPVDSVRVVDGVSLDQVWEWLEKNVTFYDESKRRERSIINKGPFYDAFKET